MEESRFSGVKAYDNKAFMNSPDARSLRILSEYVEPNTRFRELRIRDTVVIFGSARIPSREVALERLETAKQDGGDVAQAEKKLEMSRFYEETRQIASGITKWSKNLGDSDRRFVICSGGGPGIMEAANRGASEAQGENIGLNIALPFEQEENPYITRRLAFEFHYFFMRKYWFAYMAKAYIIMPGGFGTMDEFMEILTLIQTGKIKKKVALVLYGSEYWDSVINVQALVDAGTVSAGDLELFHRSDSVEDTVQYISSFLEKNVIGDPDDVDGSSNEAPCGDAQA